MKSSATILLGAVGVAIGALGLIGQAIAQPNEIKTGAQNPGVPCPQPGSLTLQATPAPSVHPADFPPMGPTQSPALLNAPGNDQVNHIFRYTFNWTVSDKLCCEVTGATLTVNLKWNGGVGHPRTASNDKIAIMNNGMPVAGLERYIWGPDTSTVYTGNQIPNPPTKTIVMNMNANALLIANKGGRLSFQVEDDTTVEAATLQINGCCIANFK
jgi:hypothetical protein